MTNRVGKDIFSGFYSRKNRRKLAEDDNTFEWGKPEHKTKKEEENEKKKKRTKLIPNFELSGKLYRDNPKRKHENQKYFESNDASIPDSLWKLMVFKNNEIINTIDLNQKTYYVFGNDREIVDIVLENPSISKQHAVIQFRKILIEDSIEKNDSNLNSNSNSNSNLNYGIGGETYSNLIQLSKLETISSKFVIKPYLMDLESRNGTFLNNQKIKSARFFELLNKDFIKFGSSTREYCLINTDEIN
ncbi:smad nuclear-interacting protein [Anaeramoeba ignava]|uniref:Smad nuclear-interacting protein n=1 Tax=Anaeramoeba ignava TaxID=1746090 RepID=A0A9Q0LP53_ANAIG|nr:smad nuclear-interacting protein [Anaeramoeba ignava]